MTTPRAGGSPLLGAELWLLGEAGGFMVLLKAKTGRKECGKEGRGESKGGWRPLKNLAGQALLKISVHTLLHNVRTAKHSGLHTQLLDAVQPPLLALHSGPASAQQGSSGLCPSRLEPRSTRSSQEGSASSRSTGSCLQAARATAAPHRMGYQGEGC